MSGATSPRAFISWVHSDDRWEKTIAEFAIALRGFGVDADVDLFHTHDHVDWAAYGSRAIEASDFVLVAISAGYRQRWHGGQGPRFLAGTAREAEALRELMKRDHERFARKVMLLVLPGANSDDIPGELLTLDRFDVPTLDLAGLEDLLRAIFGHQAQALPGLGSHQVLRPWEADRVDLEAPDVGQSERVATSEVGGRRSDAVLVAGSTSQSELVAHFLAEVERLLGGRPIDKDTLERAARIIAAEQSWRDGLGLLLDEDDVARLLDVERHRVVELASVDEVIVLTRSDGTARYPAFQFQDGRTTPALARAHRTLVDSGYISSWSAASWARVSHPELGSRSPARWAAEHRDDETLQLVARRDAARAAA